MTEFGLPPRPASKGLKIFLFSLAAVLLLCVSGSVSAVIWVRHKADRPAGASTPDQAAEVFLTAYYRSQRPDEARKAVCPKARDPKQIAAQLAALKKYADGYDMPAYTWSTPAVSDRTATSATIDVELTVTTEDMKVGKQQLRMDAVADGGWWICAVRPR